MTILECPPTVDLDAAKRILQARSGNGQSELIEVLQDVQRTYRYLPEEVLKLIAEQLDVPPIEVFRVANFYKAFALKPKGKHLVTVCMGTACHVRGAPRFLDEVLGQLKIKPGETTEDGLFTVETVNCLGACALAPVVILDGQYHSHMTAAKLRKLIQAAKKADQQATEAVRLDSVKEFNDYRKQKAEAQKSRTTTVILSSGTCGQACDSLKVVEAFRRELKAKNLEKKVALRVTGCHGFCEQEPLLIVEPKNIFYCRIKPEDVPEIVAETLQKNQIIDQLLYTDPATQQKIVHENEVPFYKAQERVVLGQNKLVDPCNIDDYIASGGYSAFLKVATKMEPEAVIAEVKKSGLRGRGGAGYPTGRKWESCRKAKGTPKYVICNADEGDPGAYMDRSVLEGNPHAVIEGMLIGAFAVGAEHGYIYVRNEYPLAVEHCRIAIQQAEKLGLLGQDILGTGFSLDIKIARGGGAFICGESTALMASLEGKVGEPRPKDVHTTEHGYLDLPSNLNNVETWANVPSIINRGAEWFASMGTRHSKGTKIFALTGKIRNTGLVEIPMGTPLRKIIYDIGGGAPDGHKVKAVQTGGPSGGCLPEKMFDLPVDFEALTEAGSMVGSGGMVVMDEDTCMVDVAKYFLTFLSDESCGKCVPCRLGVSRMLEIVTDITHGRGTMEQLDLLRELAETVSLTSLCGLGKTAANPVLSTLKYFLPEYEAHIKKKKCPAGVCRELIHYTIDKKECTGCGLCVKACPHHAIVKQGKFCRIIDANCQKCGICRDVCKFDAILVN
ncbi:MAG: NAD(P)H-dependent oxidoreductase subunit E [Verrucomicrobia bacterium]|nr:NAD(P)H-dependent oxidoreductase subunit E [Verrucomicrobiota bacterium]